jgi:hypothetical protein
MSDHYCLPAIILINSVRQFPIFEKVKSYGTDLNFEEDSKTPISR